MTSMTNSLNSSSTRLRTAICDLILRGASISPVLDESVTHVVVDFENNYNSERERLLQVLCLAHSHFLLLFDL